MKIRVLLKSILLLIVLIYHTNVSASPVNKVLDNNEMWIAAFSGFNTGYNNRNHIWDLGSLKDVQKYTKQYPNHSELKWKIRFKSFIDDLSIIYSNSYSIRYGNFGF